MPGLRAWDGATVVTGLHFLALALLLLADAAVLYVAISFPREDRGQVRAGRFVSSTSSACAPIPRRASEAGGASIAKVEGWRLPTASPSPDASSALRVVEAE